MTQVLFDRLKSDLAQCINDGTIYFVTDSNGNFTKIALGDGSKSHVVGIGPKMDDATKQELMSKLGLTISTDMGTIQLGKLANHSGVASQKVVTYERTGMGTDVHEISTVGYVHQYMKTAKAMVYAGIFNAQTKEITDYNTAIISPSEEGNVTFDYLLDGYEGETLLTPGMSFIVGTAGDLAGYTGISVYGGETKVEVGDMIIIINVHPKESVEGGSMYNEASILVMQNTNLKIADGSITTAKLADESVTASKLSTDIQSLVRNISKTATYAGIATPTTNPGTPDGPVFYIANGKGTYTNFGGIDVTEDEVVILYWDSAWHKIATGIASNDKLNELEDEVFGEKFNFIAEYTQASGYQYFPITLKPNINYSVTKSEDVVDIQLKSDTANVISLKTLNSLTLTEEEASLITQLSLYKGTVAINADIGESIEQKLGKKADKIEVDTLDGKVNNLSEDVTIIKDSMLVEEYEDANPTISGGYRSTSGNIYSGGENFAELAVSEGEKLLLYSSGTGINAQYPTAYYWNNGAYKNTIFVTDKIENVEIVVPSRVDTLYINSTKSDISIKKKVQKPVIDNIRQDVTEMDESIKNISQILPNMGKLAFNWKPFDKCYISWNNDDLRADSYLYKNLCDEFGFPYCVAASYEVVAKNTQMINGQTPVEFCKSIVANSGEILSHNTKVLTSSSTDADYNDVFNVSKGTLESAIGCKVRGIVLAGGSGYTSVDALKAQGYSMMYYDYSDLYGISPQYHMGRTQTIFQSGETDQQLADRMIAKIDDAIANKKWLRLWCHGESEVSIAALRIVFQYIQTKITEGKVEFITWSQGYDKFKPTI